MNFKNIVKVGIWTFASRILGLFRDILLARYLGAGLVSDAFFVALKIPNLFRRLFAEGSMQAAFIPIFTRLLNGNEKKAKEFAYQVFMVLLLSLIVFVILMEIFTPSVINVISPGFKSRGEDIFNFTVLLVRITLPYLFFISLVSFYSSILNALGKFALVAFLPALLNIAMIITLLFGNFLHNYAIAASLGVLLGGILQFLIVIYFCYKNNWFVKLKVVRFNSFLDESKEFLKKLIPVLVGSGVYQVNIIVDILVASLLPSGVISYLFYADRVYQLPLAIIGIAIATVVLPAISNKITSTKEQNDAIKENALLLALGFSLFATFAIVALSETIVKTIFFGGSFAQEATHATGVVLLIYAFSLPLNILIKVILPFFYAEGDTKTPLYSTIVCLIVNLFLVFILAKHFGYKGIALATVIASLINFIILIAVYHKNHKFSFSKGLYSELIKIIFVGIVMSIFLYMINHFYLKDMTLYLLRFSMFVLIIFTIFMVLFMLKLIKSRLYNGVIMVLKKEK